MVADTEALPEPGRRVPTWDELIAARGARLYSCKDTPTTLPVRGAAAPTSPLSPLDTKCPPRSRAAGPGSAPQPGRERAGSPRGERNGAHGRPEGATAPPGAPLQPRSPPPARPHGQRRRSGSSASAPQRRAGGEAAPPHRCCPPPAAAPGHRRPQPGMAAGWGGLVVGARAACVGLAWWGWCLFGLVVGLVVGLAPW